MKEIIKAVLETLQETGGNAPETPIYLAFQAHGMSLDQFNLLMMRMEESNLISRQNHTLSLLPRGNQLLSALR